VLPLHHTPKSIAIEQPCSVLRVQRYYFFPNYQNFLQKNYKKPQNFLFSFAFRPNCSTFALQLHIIIFNGTNKTTRSSYNRRHPRKKRQ